MYTYMPRYDFFASSPYAGDYEVSTAVEAACDACQEPEVACHQREAAARGPAEENTQTRQTQTSNLML